MLKYAICHSCPTDFQQLLSIHNDIYTQIQKTKEDNFLLHLLKVLSVMVNFGQLCNEVKIKKSDS
jgi:hypothetical protein